MRYPWSGIGLLFEAHEAAREGGGRIVGAGATWKDLGGPYTITGSTLTVRLTNQANQYVIADAVRIERIDAGPRAPHPGLRRHHRHRRRDRQRRLRHHPRRRAADPAPSPSEHRQRRPRPGSDLSLPAGFTPGRPASRRHRRARRLDHLRRPLRRGGGRDLRRHGQLRHQRRRGPTRSPRPLGRRHRLRRGTGRRRRRRRLQHRRDAGPPSPTRATRMTSTTPPPAPAPAPPAGPSAGLTPGTYRVSATWFAFSNRATNAPFTVLDGTTPLATVAVNQQTAPNDFNDPGATWQDLGGAVHDHRLDPDGPARRTRPTSTSSPTPSASNESAPPAPAPAGPGLRRRHRPSPTGPGSVDFGTTPVGTPADPHLHRSERRQRRPRPVGNLSLPPASRLAAGPGAAGRPRRLGHLRRPLRRGGGRDLRRHGQPSPPTTAGNANPFDFALSAAATTLHRGTGRRRRRRRLQHRRDAGPPSPARATR